MSNCIKVNSLIAKCVLKNSKYVVSFFLCAVVCFIMLPIIPMYSVIMKKANNILLLIMGRYKAKRFFSKTVSPSQFKEFGNERSM